MIGLVGLSMLIDLTSQRVPNILISIGLVVGLMLDIMEPSSISVMDSILGFTLGFALFLYPYSKSYLGAGDLKLIAMIGVYLGPFGTMATILYTSLFGGVCVLLYLVYVWIKNMNFPKNSIHVSSRTRLPYAGAIFLGVCLELLKPNLLLNAI